MRVLRNIFKSRRLTSAVTAALAVFILAGCTLADTGEDNRRDAVTQRERVFNKAEHMYPVVEPSNFPIRKALVEFTVRQDMINHPWYIYLQGMTGEVYGYFIGQTYPISTCDFLSSSESISSSQNGKVVVTAPSLDGIFYGGGGSSAACDGMFFFDVTTNAMITFSSPNWFATDQPLQIDAPRLNSTGTVPDEAPPADTSPAPTLEPSS